MRTTPVSLLTAHVLFCFRCQREVTRVIDDVTLVLIAAVREWFGEWVFVIGLCDAGLSEECPKPELWV